MESIAGIRVFNLNSNTDFRGNFVKIQPFENYLTSLDSIAISTNPSIGTIRGLHFQVEPFAEEKLVTCIQGAVFDAVVDIRPGSATFGKWASLELSDKNRVQLYLPKGIAHGFQTLTSDSIVHYCLSATHSAASSYSINPLGELGINWPINDHVVSDKDKNGLDLMLAAQKYGASLKNNWL